MANPIPNLKMTELNRLLQRSAQPVLIDFWGTGCEPCKLIEQSVLEIAREYQGKIRVCKVNLIENLEIAKEYNISSIPTLLLVKKGKVAGRIIGLHSKSEISKFITSVN